MLMSDAVCMVSVLAVLEELSIVLSGAAASHDWLDTWTYEALYEGFSDSVSIII